MKKFNFVLLAFFAAVLFAGCDQKPAEKEPQAAAKVEEPETSPKWMEELFKCRIDKPWGVHGKLEKTSDWGYKSYWHSSPKIGVTTISNPGGFVISSIAWHACDTEEEASKVYHRDVEDIIATFHLTKEENGKDSVILTDPKFPDQKLLISLDGKYVNYKVQLSPLPTIKENEMQGLPITGAFGVTLGKPLPAELEDKSRDFKPQNPLPIFDSYDLHKTSDQRIYYIRASGSDIDADDVLIALRHALEKRYNMKMEHIIYHSRNEHILTYQKGSRKIELTLSNKRAKIEYMDSGLLRADIKKDKQETTLGIQQSGI